MLEASFAKNLLGAIPAEEVKFVRSYILPFILLAISIAFPKSFSQPVTSKKPSSQPTNSTSGVN